MERAVKFAFFYQIILIPVILIWYKLFRLFSTFHPDLDYTEYLYNDGDDATPIADYPVQQEPEYDAGLAAAARDLRANLIAPPPPMDLIKASSTAKPAMASTIMSAPLLLGVTCVAFQEPFWGHHKVRADGP